MALIFFDKEQKLSVIHEVPKCGSYYIAKTMGKNDIGCMQTNVPGFYNPICYGVQKEVMGHNSSHCIPIRNSIYELSEKKNRLAIVRHPLTWLMSWWRFKENYAYSKELVGRTWRKTSRFDQLCKSDDFNEFIDKLIAFYPNGIVGHFFQSYINESGCVGKVEEIDKILRWFIHERLGVYREFITSGKPLNTTQHKELRYTKNQASKIMEIEKDFCSRFEYKCTLF